MGTFPTFLRFSLYLLLPTPVSCCRMWPPPGPGTEQPATVQPSGSCLSPPAAAGTIPSLFSRAVPSSHFSLDQSLFCQLRAVWPCSSLVPRAQTAGSLCATSEHRGMWAPSVEIMVLDVHLLEGTQYESVAKGDKLLAT